jgi:hypothetical protein
MHYFIWFFFPEKPFATFSMIWEISPIENALCKQHLKNETNVKKIVDIELKHRFGVFQMFSGNYRKKLGNIYMCMRHTPTLEPKISENMCVCYTKFYSI